MISEAVEQRPGQPLGGEDAGPFIEGKVAGDDGRAALVVLAEHLEQMTQDTRGTISFAPRPALLRAISAAVQDQLDISAIEDMSLHARSGVATVKVQAKALRADYLCVDSKATKP